MVTKNLFQTMNKISMNPIMNAPMSKGRVYEQSLEKYFELTEQEDLAKLVANIRHAEDHDERRNLKANLPFRCPHYFRFKDNRRSQASIIPEAFTWQTCVGRMERPVTPHGVFGIRQTPHRHPHPDGYDHP